MHCSQWREVSSLIENDFIAIYPPEVAPSDWYKLILKDKNDLLSVFYSNFASIMHRFVYIEVLLLTGNDVISKSPPRGAPGGSHNLQRKDEL